MSIPLYCCVLCGVPAYACYCCVGGPLRKYCCYPGDEVPAITPDDTLRIAFTSCSHQDAPKLYYKNMSYFTPDVIVLGGDNIYIDQTVACCEDSDLCWKWFGAGGNCHTFDEYYKHDEQYEKLFKRPDMCLDKEMPGEENERLRTNWPPVVLATWDDHDFGGNWSGADYENRVESKHAFLRFLSRLDSKGVLTRQIEEMSRDDARGIFYYYDHEKAGQMTRFYMMDCRYYRTDEEILGEVQWEWLREVICDAKENGGINKHVFVNGSSMLIRQVNCMGMKAPEEVWPLENRDKFIALLKELDVINKSIMLAGDIHMSVALHMDGLNEFVHSAMSHAVNDTALEIYSWADFFCKPFYSGGDKLSRLTNVNGFSTIDISMTENTAQFCVFGPQQIKKKREHYKSSTSCVVKME